MVVDHHHPSRRARSSSPAAATPSTRSISSIADKKPLPRFALPGTLRAQRRAQARRPSTRRTSSASSKDPIRALKNEYVVMSAHLDHVGVGRAVNGDSHLQRRDGRRVGGGVGDRDRAAAEGVRREAEAVDPVHGRRPARRRGCSDRSTSRRTRPCPSTSIVADINLDMFLPLYPLKVIEVQGLTESSLGESVRAAAKELGVDVQTDREPEQNRFIRSDQYSFIRRGVPGAGLQVRLRVRLAGREDPPRLGARPLPQAERRPEAAGRSRGRGARSTA